MKKKHISSLLFSLLILATCNNMKAVFQRGKIKRELAEARKKLNSGKECQTNLEACEKHGEELEQNNTDLQEQLTTAREELTKQEGQCLQLENQIQGENGWAAQVRNLTDEFNANKEVLSQKRRELDKLSAEQGVVKDSTEKASAVAKEVNRLERERKELKLQLEEARTDRDDANADLTTAEQRSDSLRSQLAQANSTKGQATTDLAQANANLTAAEKTSEYLRSQLTQANSAEDQAKRVSSTFNRYQPYIYGTTIAGATYFGLSRFGNERTKPLCKAVGDSLVLQGASLSAATYSDKYFKSLHERSNKEVARLGHGLKAGAINVAGETGNSLLLRWGWNKWFAKRMEESNNIIVRTVKKWPLLSDIARLAAVHKCWKFEKNLVFFKKRTDK